MPETSIGEPEECVSLLNKRIGPLKSLDPSVEIFGGGDSLASGGKCFADAPPAEWLAPPESVSEVRFPVGATKPRRALRADWMNLHIRNCRAEFSA
jgi:hypothetical protein